MQNVPETSKERSAIAVIGHLNMRPIIKAFETKNCKLTKER